MSGEEFVLAIVGLVMGSAVVIVAITKLTGLIKSWINRNNTSLDEETFERLAKAFVRFKKDAEQRIQSLEAIIADQDNTSGQQLEEPKGTIEIEDEEERGSKSDSGNLSNMLRE